MTVAPTRWNLATRLLHWLSAALIATLLGLGVDMVWLVDDAARRFDLYQRHKTLGAVVFVLALARLVARAARRGPGWPERMAPLHRAAAGGAHAALYALMFAAPLTGYAMISTSPIPLPIVLPGGLSVPNLLSPDFAASERWKVAHHACVLALGLLAAGHAGAALWRRFVIGDDVLARMAFGGGAGSP